jgi:hypothetical protein
MRQGQVHGSSAKVATSEQRPSPWSGVTGSFELGAKPISEANDFENQVAAGVQFRVTIRHIEDGLDQDLNPGLSQVIQSDLVLFLPHARVLPDQLLDAVSERSQTFREGAERHSDVRLEATMRSGTKVGDADCGQFGARGSQVVTRRV